MKTVNPKQAPFQHEFYALALRNEGSHREVNGHPAIAHLFFNSPYQIISWEIFPDWQGWYIIFDREFLSRNLSWANFIIDYPFFRLDKQIDFDLPIQARIEAELWFQKIFEEYHSNRSDKFTFIQAYTQLLLSQTKRHFEHLGTITTHQGQRTADALLLSRFQTLIETMTANINTSAKVRQPSFYAEELGVHPNHLNAVVKRSSGKTTSQIIQQYVLNTAQALLRQTNLSAKEIAFRLHFQEPTHFAAFFKKMTGTTPQQFREAQNITT